MSAATDLDKTRERIDAKRAALVEAKDIAAADLLERDAEKKLARLKVEEDGLDVQLAVAGVSKVSVSTPPSLPTPTDPPAGASAAAAAAGKE